MKPWKKWLLSIAVPCVLWALFYLYNIFFPWTRLWSSESEINIHSGRVRSANFIFYCPYGEKVRDTPLTKALAPEDLASLQPDWKPVNTFSLGTRNSPHYKFHGATSQIYILATIWETYQFDANARRETSRTILRLWQTNGDDSKAHSYLRGLSQLLEKNEKKTRPRTAVVHVEDLPTSYAAINAD